MDLPGEKAAKIQVLVPDDKPATRPEHRNVARWTNGWDLSPSAKRAVVEARGDLFTVPAEKGDVRNLTRTPGAASGIRPGLRTASGSPICRRERRVRGPRHRQRRRLPDRQVTKGGTTFRFAPVWSPDSSRIAFSDKTMTLWWVDVATGKVTKVDKSEDGEIHDYQWSSDSRWLAYSRPMPSQVTSQLVLYSTETGEATPVTSGLTDDANPAFDPRESGSTSSRVGPWPPSSAVRAQFLLRGHRQDLRGEPPQGRRIAVAPRATRRRGRRRRRTGRRTTRSRSLPARTKGRRGARRPRGRPRRMTRRRNPRPSGSTSMGSARGSSRSPSPPAGTSASGPSRGS